APHARARQLEAFATPFFGVEWAVLSGYRRLPGDHPFIGRLDRWHALATQERYAALFHEMLHQSGLVPRQLFLGDDDRQLTNVQHTLEVLLEVATRRRLSPTELLEQLDRFIDGRAVPDTSTSAVQRLPDEREAVQIMTIHKSKGLEAPVVALFGGFRPGFADPVQVVHVDGGRRVLIGEAARTAAADRVDREALEEDQRLLYVALTRAQVKLIVPFADSSRAIKGSYQALNRRLKAMSEAGELSDAAFAVEEIDARPPMRTSGDATSSDALSTWTPPPRLFEGAEAPSPLDDFVRLRARHAPLVVTSYTRLKEERDLLAEAAPVEADEFKIDLGAEVAPRAAAFETLPGGRFVGRFLHEAIERLPFAAFVGRDFFAWKAEPAVEEAFAWAMRRHEIDARWLLTSQRIVYEALTRPIRLGGRRRIDGLCRARELREMEFLYPIPEDHHPLLGTGEADEDGWRVERGYIKGFIDFVFEHGGRYYWADWKSDVLPGYAPAQLEPHVEAHYDLQAQLYTLGMVRLLGLRDEESYDRRFGGLIYLFLRAFGGDAAPDDGVWFYRPSWPEVLGYEESLRQGLFTAAERAGVER
ncbi:MAG: PD-(D/E)XK nuclease family protein, partial [Myxococcales bacterium]|nr:PD-(D/E)XK nuclease family protein [Myxococcales bacterium]